MNEDRDQRRTPAGERTSDQSAQEAGRGHEKLEGFKAGPGPELAREADVEDVLNRNVEKRYQTPRRYEEGADEEPRDPAMPANDSTLNTKI